MLVIYIGSVIAVLAFCELVFEFSLWAAFWMCPATTSGCDM